MKLDFSWEIFKQSQILSLMNLHVVGAELFHMDSEWTETNSPVLQFNKRLKTPKMMSIYNSKCF
jgi:hypothetical protein